MEQRFLRGSAAWDSEVRKRPDIGLTSPQTSNLELRSVLFCLLWPPRAAACVRTV